MANSNSKFDVKTHILEKICEDIEAGNLPWERKWSSSGLPSNAISGRNYNGLNLLYLWLMADIKGYSTDRWITFNQARSIGANYCKSTKKWTPKEGFEDNLPTVRKGEKSTYIMCPVMIDRKDKDGKPVLNKSGKPDKVLVGFKPGFVFNLDQIDNLPKSFTESEKAPFDPGVDGIAALERLEDIARLMGVPIIERGDSCSYSPSKDRIMMSPKDSFKDPVDFIRVLAHELSHSTGHKTRLDRPDFHVPSGKWSPEYAFEELVAELSAAMTCCQLGIEYKSAHATYIHHYLEVIKEAHIDVDKRKGNTLMKAANMASAASQFLLDVE
ncbi:hypothetical protein A3715_28555, partial [Oleiphilus sp. HI0009]